MQITFCGAAGTVTGSCYLVTTEFCKFIVDCGMFQGSKEIRSLNRSNFQFIPGEIDFVLLTHAHIDHSGLLPKLWKLGFKNSIYATKPTLELSQIALPDSGHIQEMDAEWRNRKLSRKGLEPIEPLYTANDALSCLKHFVAQSYLEEFEPVPGVKVKFLDAGHILGSSIIEIRITEKSNGEGKPETTKIVFSGDLGQKNQPIIQDPTYIQEADYVIVESTYGNRLHEEHYDRVEMLRKIIIQSVESGGNLVIPAFAIERTQDLLYHIKNLLKDGKIPRIPVYIDSPMAVSATEIFRNNPGYYDEPTLKMLQAGDSPFDFPSLKFIRTTDESRKLNETARGAIIISASGMCEAGRILHHLKHNLWRRDAHILFVGYQAEGTLGRRLLEGAKVVKIMGEEVNVQATVHSIDGFSAHADQHGLLDWLGGFTQKPKGIFLVHGEAQAQQELATLVKTKMIIGADGLKIPKLGECFILNAIAHPAAVQVKPGVGNYQIHRAITDLEHSILTLRYQVKQAEQSQSIEQIEHVKQLVAELESLIKEPA